MSVVPELQYQLTDRNWLPLSRENYVEWTHQDVLDWLMDLNEDFYEQYGSTFRDSVINGRNFEQLQSVSFLRERFGMPKELATQLSIIARRRIQHYQIEHSQSIKSELQVSKIKRVVIDEIVSKIECEICGDELDEKVQLFQCVNEECKRTKTGRIFCEECFPVGRKLHQKYKRQHSFDRTQKHIICINEMVDSFRNSNYQKGVQKGETRSLQLQRFQRFANFQHFFGILTDVFTVGGEITSTAASAQEIAVSIAEIISIETLQFIGGGIGATVACGLELCVLFYRKYAGKIETWTELLRLVGKSVIGNAVVFGSFVGCVAAGSLLGPGGSVAGIVTGIIVGCALRWRANKIYDTVFKSSENNERVALAEEALGFFHFGKDTSVIDDEKVFNKKEIKRRYHGLALLYHPDKNGSQSNENWLSLCSNYGILTAICDERDNKNNINDTISGDNVNDERSALLSLPLVSTNPQRE